MKIIKLHAATCSAGNGFGAHRAAWAVQGRADIRIWRECGFWKAFSDGRKHVATSQRELEAMLAVGAAEHACLEKQACLT